MTQELNLNMILNLMLLVKKLLEPYLNFRTKSNFITRYNSVKSFEFYQNMSINNYLRSIFYLPTIYLNHLNVLC